MNKLLQINVVGNYGSTGHIAEEIGSLAIFNGWKSYIACARNIRTSQSEIIKIGNVLDIYYHILKTRITDRHGFASKLATRRLIKSIEKIQPDIIHLHNLHGYYINIKILFDYLSTIKIPIIWTLHDCWSFTGHCAYFDFINCNKWEIQCYNCPQKRIYPSSLLLDSSKKNFICKNKLFNKISNLTLIPVSNWLSSLIGKSFLNLHNCKTIHNGIDLNIFRPVNSSYFQDKYNTNKKFVILGLTNIWADRKGLNDFILLDKLINHSNYQIILVGLNKKQMKVVPPTIKCIIRTENIDELVALYSLADVFVNPTWEDNFPTTNIEALACGTPIVTYKTGGSPEAIDKETGIIIEKGDVDGLYQAIKKIGERSRAFYIKKCRNRAISLFSKQDRYNEYINLYKSLLNQ